MRGGVIVVLMLALGAPAEAGDEQARRDFVDGKTAYDQGDFPRAYRLFEQAYRRSKRPELLYNMARAQEGMARYGEAAETLRSYLRLAPSTPDRAEIEEHARALDERQRASPDLHLGETWPPPAKRRTAIVVGVVVASVAVVAIAVGLGVGLGTRAPSYSPADVGPLRATP